MGTKVAPVYATLTLGFLESSLYHSPEYPLLNSMFRQYYFRFLDDILLIFDERLTDVNAINSMLNSLHPELCFKLETSGLAVNFLDVKITSVNNNLKTDVFYKATDSKQYLNFHSHHPRHVKIALPYNLARRICAIVSDNELRKQRLDEMRGFLLKCNYPKKTVRLQNN